jgi:small membrane protein
VLIKVLLILALVSFSLMALRRRQTATSRAGRRIGLAAIVICGIIAVLWPGITGRIANAVGVGRGTDLILYVLFVAFLFVTLNVYLNFRDIEAKYTAAIREIALLEARVESARPPVSDPSPEPPPAERGNGH